MARLLLMFLFLIIASEAHAAKFVKFKYKVKPNEDLAEILKIFTKDSAIINRNTPTIEKIFNNNDTISNWANLRSGDEFYLYIEEESFDYLKFNNYMKESTMALDRIIKSKGFYEKFVPQGYKAYAYAMTSFGNLNQNKDEVADISFKQTSPYTLGLNNAYFFKGSKWGIHGGGFYSAMDASIENLNNTKLDISAEYGINAYSEYRLDKLSLSLFMGVEIENFHSFNLDELSQNSYVMVDETDFIYGAIGLSKYFKIYDHEFIARLMFSKSISSNYKTKSLLENQNKFDSNKLMLYLNYKFNQRVFLNSIIKYQSLSGNSDMTSMRFGIGVGYAFF